MFNRILPLALACATASFAPVAAAQQQQQTAEGAQRFLALLAKDGGNLFVKVPERTGTDMTVQGSRKTTYRWLKDGLLGNGGPYDDYTEPATLTLKWMLGITKIAAMDAAGNPDPCTTRLDTVTREKVGKETSDDNTFKKETFFGFDYLNYRRTITEQYEDPAVKFAGPHHIAWGKAVIVRNGGRITARVPAGKFNTELVYAGDERNDADMADRVEFAMKFLKASCDKTAATGF